MPRGSDTLAPGVLVKPPARQQEVVRGILLGV